MARTDSGATVRVERITQAILLLRGERVILDAELAALYGVTTKRLNEQVKRNTQRFPEDFMFRLSRTETETLNRSQIATGTEKHRNPRFPPFVFTELERKLKGHDEAITAILSAIRELMKPPVTERRGIGFTADFEETKQGCMPRLER